MKKIILLVLICLFLTGCNSISGEELVTLPNISPEYKALQSSLNLATDGGFVFSAPTGNKDSRAVDFVDIYGDGVEEAVVYLKSNSKLELKVVIFTKKDGKFTEMMSVFGEGNYIENARFVDLNGDSIMELVLGYKLLDSKVGGLNVYGLEKGEAYGLLSTDYSSIAVGDINDDKKEELVVVKHDAKAGSGKLELYSYDGEEVYLMNDLMMLSESEFLKASSEAELINAVKNVLSLKKNKK